MELKVKRTDGTTITLDVSVSDTILNLKQQIRDMTGIEIDRQRLVFSGGNLEDHRSIYDYGIQMQSTVHLIVKVSA